MNDTTLVMTFDEELDENAVPAATAFGMVYTTDGRSVQREGHSIAISGATVTVTLAARVPHGVSAGADYVAGSAGADPLQDRSGNDVVSFHSQLATNNTPPAFSSAAVNGSALTVTFDGALDEAAGSVPAAGDFAVTVGRRHGESGRDRPGGGQRLDGHADAGQGGAAQ